MRTGPKISTAIDLVKRDFSTVSMGFLRVLVETYLAHAEVLYVLRVPLYVRHALVWTVTQTRRTSDIYNTKQTNTTCKSYSTQYRRQFHAQIKLWSSTTFSACFTKLETAWSLHGSSQTKLPHSGLVIYCDWLQPWNGLIAMTGFVKKAVNRTWTARDMMCHVILD